MANLGEKPDLSQISADTRKEFAAEVAARVQRKLERKSKRQQWADRLEAAAQQAMHVTSPISV